MGHQIPNHLFSKYFNLLLQKLNPMEKLKLGGGVEAAQISQKISNWSDVPSSWKKLGAYKKISFASDPYDKNLQKFLEPFASDDDLRPNMTGMYFDDTGITCTDAHKLIVLPYPNPENKGIYCTFKRCSKLVSGDFKIDKSGKLIEKLGKETRDAKYPKYEAVIPIRDAKKQNHDKINLRKLLTYINVAENFANVTTHQINFKYKGGLIGFNSTFLKTICEAMLYLGYEDVWFHTSTPDRAVVVTPSETYKLGVEVLMLCMPVHTDSKVYSDTPGAEDMDWEKEISVYFDFSDNEIHNADKTVADFYKDEKVITIQPEQIRFLKSAIDKNIAIPILDHVGVISGNAIGADFENYAIIKESGLKDGEYDIVNGELVWHSGANEIDQFPKVYTAKEELGKMYAPEFEKVYDDAVKFTIKNDLQSEFEGVHLFTKDKQLVMESCDAAIAYRNIVNGFEFKKEFDFVLQIKCIKNFLNYVGDANITISDTDWNGKGASTAWISLSAADAELSIRTITPTKKKYPSLDAVIPSEAANKITFERKQLEQLIDKIDVPALKKKYEYLKKRTDQIAISLKPKTENLQPSGKIEVFMIIWESGYSNKENTIIERTQLGTIDYDYDDKTSSVNKEKFAIIMPVRTVAPEDMFVFAYDKLKKIIDSSEQVGFALQWAKPDGVFVNSLSKGNPLVKIASAKDTVRALELLIELSSGEELEKYTKELEKIKGEHKGEKFGLGGKLKTLLKFPKLISGNIINPPAIDGELVGEFDHMEKTGNDFFKVKLPSGKTYHTNGFTPMEVSVRENLALTQYIKDIDGKVYRVDYLYNTSMPKGEKFASGGEINKGLTDIFVYLYEHNKEIKDGDIPSAAKNKFAEWQGDFLYAGSRGTQNIDDIKSWTSDKETAKVFATKYKDGKVFEMRKGEFKKKFNFISLDVFADYIEEKGLWNKRIDKYVSESEVYVLSQKFTSGGGLKLSTRTYNKEAVKNIILAEGLYYAVWGYMDEDAIDKKEKHLWSLWKEAYRKVNELDDISTEYVKKNPDSKLAKYVSNDSPSLPMAEYVNNRFKKSSMDAYSECPENIKSLAKRLEFLFPEIVKEVGLDKPEYLEKFADGGAIEAKKEEATCGCAH